MILVLSLERSVREQEIVEGIGREESRILIKWSFLQRLCPCFCFRSDRTTDAATQVTLLPQGQETRESCSELNRR